MDISKKIDSKLKERIREVTEVLESLEIPFLIVGAAARDLFFHYGYNFPIKRATKDVDFGIQVPSWDAFNAATSGLVKIGFEVSNNAQRLFKDDIYPIDVVPFGGVAVDSNLSWPPDGGFNMNVLGFNEALLHAIEFTLCISPILKVKVASPSGLTLMKLIAWTDRAVEKRGKDASDFKYIVESMERAPDLQERLYDENLLVEYDGDTLLICAYLLGADVSNIMCEQSKEILLKLFNDKNLLDYFLNDMGGNAA